MSESDNEKSDHGEVLARPGLRISWAWLFPILAALAAGWLFWSEWKSQGPEVEIEFASAPGIEPGKTNLVYRGVVAGTVQRIHLDDQLKKVVVTVRLKAFAAGLAREGTLFWIDQPVIGLGRTSGIESLIQGNSLNARMGSGPPARHFTGSEVVPLSQIDEPGLILKLKSANVPFLDRGSPIYHKGVMIGAVRGKELTASHEPVLNIMIEKPFVGLVRSNSRFWLLPAASAKLGSGMMQIDLAGLKALLLGAITMDSFEETGGPVKEGDTFELSANEFAARADSPPVRVTFDDALGLRPGITELRFRGLPVGLVESVRADVSTGTVEATVRLAAGYESLRGEGAAFTLVRPRVSLEGISGIETLIAGIYIDCIPGDAARPLERFAGSTATDVEAHGQGLTVTLHAKEIPTIDAGAPVLLRGIVVGKVKEKSFDKNNEPSLTLVIRQEFARTLTANAKFWRVPATSVEAGPEGLSVGVASLQSLWKGGVAFDVFGAPGEPVKEGARFELFASEASALDQGLTVTLHAKEIPTIDAGAPVLLRGIIVGKVKAKSFGKNNEPSLTLVIRQEFARTLTANAKFWRVPAATVEAGPGVLNVGVSALQALWKGGVAFDVFGAPGDPASDGARFELFANERTARAGSPPVRIDFANGQGILAGQTQLRYLGVPVGLVEDVKPAGGKVHVTARLNPGYDSLRRRGSTFTLVRPSISLQGVSGLETLVSGVFIECVPGPQGPPADQFRGLTIEGSDSAESGFQIVIRSASTSVEAGAPVLYRGVQVGRIVSKTLAPDGRSADLTASVDRPHAALLRQNTKFWDAGGVRASLGFLGIKVRTGSLQSLALGGIEFGTPESKIPSPPVRQGHVFLLSDSPPKNWPAPK